MTSVATAKSKQTVMNAKGNQNNQWHLQDFRGGNNLPYIKVKKNT
jgi:hypothetical protein